MFKWYNRWNATTWEFIINPFDERSLDLLFFYKSLPFSLFLFYFIHNRLMLLNVHNSLWYLSKKFFLTTYRELFFRHTCQLACVRQQEIFFSSSRPLGSWLLHQLALLPWLFFDSYFVERRYSCVVVVVVVIFVEDTLNAP